MSKKKKTNYLFTDYSFNHLDKKRVRKREENWTCGSHEVVFFSFLRSKFKKKWGVCMLCMHTSIVVYRGRKTASEHLELVLQAVASQSCGP